MYKMYVLVLQTSPKGYQRECKRCSLRSQSSRGERVVLNVTLSNLCVLQRYLDQVLKKSLKIIGFFNWISILCIILDLNILAFVVEHKNE